ncbi:MAG TPA: hypothetical protein VLZ74_15720 [Methylocella sp.]|nr:hypothetical protein [Methylocella sp.]
MKSIARNCYINLDPEPEPIDVFAPKAYRGGKDFYISVFKHIEEATNLSGFTFYLAYHVPESLPEYGTKIVLVVFADEAFSYRDYFSNIHCIIRCLGTRPLYLDGFPVNKLHVTALLHFLYKQWQYVNLILREFQRFHRLKVSEASRKTLHIPLAFYSYFQPDARPILDREIDYAFLGSISFDERFTKWIHRQMKPPKMLARRLMLDALQRVPKSIKGKIHTTGDFWESIKNHCDYEATLGNTKISICPRGTTYETYRFFESCKAGCVIICEPLPDVWFYKGHPGIVIKDWSRLPAIIEELIADEAILVARSAAALDYWNNVISESAVAIRVAEFVDGCPSSEFLKHEAA